MNEIENSKILTMLPPQLKNDGDFDGNTYADTQGFSDLRAMFIVGTLDAAIGSTAEGTPLLVEECDTTDGSYTAVAGAALSAVIGAGDDNKNFCIGVDLRKTHKRYMRVQVPHSGAGTTGGNLCIIGELSSPQRAVETDEASGFEERVFA